ncbi:MAG: hypothetical protein LBD02_06650 [Christensenellaceae bacterium]|jgi:uncharacterized membrane protein|nr:hypothetical protein [Christensenellaceae bacterium]
MMETFKSTLRRRIVLGAIYCSCACLLLALCVNPTVMRSTELRNGGGATIVYFAGLAANQHIPSFILGEITGVGLVMLAYILRCWLALRDETRLKKLYIAQKDERTALILDKAGGTALSVVIFGLALGAAAAGLFSEIAFFALNAAMLFALLVKAGFKLFYGKTL